MSTTHVGAATDVGGTGSDSYVDDMPVNYHTKWRAIIVFWMENVYNFNVQLLTVFTRQHITHFTAPLHVFLHSLPKAPRSAVKSCQKGLLACAKRRLHALLLLCGRTWIPPSVQYSYSQPLGLLWMITCNYGTVTTIIARRVLLWNMNAFLPVWKDLLYMLLPWIHACEGGGVSRE